ncbi:MULTISPECIES: HAD family hydrolase [Vagococcus]|uniref:HAD family hydrolase n=2 Tax=Vagococcus teuberi TaxID=519472 RepID=A0A1J0A796_9ENTE|nr:MULTISPECIES: HAD family hydrolase [Vagococcus]APB31785.1 hypothetical protein BHY08_08090 [Vagococcus teuberi]
MTVVVFDVDDTLYDQFVPFELAMTHSFQDKPWIKDMDLSTLYLLFRHHSDEMFPATVSGELSLEDMRVYRIQKALKDLGVEATDRKCQLFQDRYFYEQNRITVHPEMVDLLLILKERQILTGILTNGPTNHQQLKLDQLNVSTWIDSNTHHISESIGYSKPDAKAFQVVANSYPESTEFLYIGDSYDNDVIGAKNAGWQVIWLNKYNKKLTQEMVKPDVEVTSYKELAVNVLDLLQEE